MKDRICSCRLIVDDYMVAEETNVNVNEEQLANLNAFFRGIRKRPITPMQFILIGKEAIPLKSHPSAILDNFRTILWNFPCHKCHNAILKSMLSSPMPTRVDRKRLRNKKKFMVKVLKNLRVNKKTFIDNEIVAFFMQLLWLFRRFRNYDMKTFIVSKMGLSPMMPTVFGHYMKLKPTDGVHEEILKALTVRFLNKTGGNRQANNSIFEEVLMEAMVVFFSNNTRITIWSLMRPGVIFSLIFGLISSVMEDKEEWLDVWVCCDSYTRKFHDSIEWKSDSEVAMKYLLLITTLIFLVHDFKPDKTRSQTEGVKGENSRMISKYFEQILIRLIEVLRKVDSACYNTNTFRVDVMHRIESLVVLHDKRGSYCPIDLDFVSELSDIFALRIQEILENENGELDHDRETDNLYFDDYFPNSFKHTSSEEERLLVTDKSDLDIAHDQFLYEMFYRVENFHEIQAVRTANFNVLNAFIRAARFRCQFGLDIRILALLKRTVRYNLCDTEALLTSGIPQTIFTNINHLHMNCNRCVELCEYVYNPILELMRPKGKVDINSERSAELAISLPYVTPNRYQLVYEMYPKGFDLLAARLRHGQCIESLYLVSQILQFKIEPQVYQSIACLDKLSETIDEDEPGTRIFILDDGTRIRARTAPLVQNSPFFSTLLNGGFVEATQKEIFIPDATPFEFCFLVNSTTAVNEPAPKTTLKFSLDLQTHLRLYRFCDKFLMQKLCNNLVDSMVHLVTPEILPKIYKSALQYACGSLRLMCMDITLRMSPGNKIRMLEELFQTLDNKLLADDAKKWMMHASRETIRAIRHKRPSLRH